MLACSASIDWPRPDAEEGPAVLRLRMLEIDHALRVGVIKAQARIDAQRAFEALRHAVLTRPASSIADALARARTRADMPLQSGGCEAV